MASTSTSEVAHPVVFTTQTTYPLPTQKFMIPASWRRYQLSQLVNKALSLAKPIPFDFLIKGEILRTTLGEWCAERSIGEEETLEIEYIESVMPPQKMTSLPHEDWVSSISCREPGYFFTASYDGQLRVFDYSQNLVQSIPVHEAPATSLHILPGPSDSADTRLVATASHDLSARLTLVDLTPGSGSTSARTLASLHLHTGPLTSITASRTGQHLLTTAHDDVIGVWDVSIPSKDEIPLEDTRPAADRKKRRKLAIDQNERPRRKVPLLVLKSHTARISKAVFVGSGSSEAVSAGFDSTVRLWDTENGLCTRTISASSKPFLDVAVMPSEQTVLAASTDRTVTQYDLRSADTASLTSTIATVSHPATPSCIAVASSQAQSTSQHQFITGAYDGSVRLWDLRSLKSPVASFKVWDGRKKILSVDWQRGMVGVGGEGGVEVWRMNEGDRVPSS